MKHAREDYNRIQDPDGIIPADEPVFLLRGQDPYAARAVKYYSYLLAQSGAVDPTIAAAAAMQAEAMHRWPNKKTAPDMPDGADVSPESLRKSQAALNAMLTGVVLDFVSYLTGAGADAFQKELDANNGEPSSALVEGMKAWAQARHVDDGHANMDWRKLIEDQAPGALDR